MPPAALAPIFAVYKYALAPVGPLAWLGAPISALDLAAAFRLAVVLRQLREAFRQEYTSSTSASANGDHGQRARPSIESRARTRDFATTLVMVYGGEAVVAPWLGIQPSFLLSGSIPALYLGAQVLVDFLPSVPFPSIHNEAPLAVLDAFTRATLLCNIVPTVVTNHVSSVVSSSPWTLLVTALIMANGGPLFTNALSLLHPTPIGLRTPPELLPYGWTATDLWVAPLVTGLYATLTHAQPFFALLHELLYTVLSPVGLASFNGRKELQPVDPDTARAVCVLVLGSLFVTRTVKTFGGASIWSTPGRTVGGTVAQKSMVNGSGGAKKTKTQ